MKTKAVLEFLKTYGTRVRDNEEDSYVQLMMDDHKCVEFENKEYYIPEECSAWDEEDEEIYDFLVENHSL